MVEIKVKKSPHLQCARCWNATKDVSYSRYWLDDLCGRCAKVLCGLEEQGKWHRGEQHELREED